MAKLLITPKRLIVLKRLIMLKVFQPTILSTVLSEGMDDFSGVLSTFLAPPFNPPPPHFVVVDVHVQEDRLDHLVYERAVFALL